MADLGLEQRDPKIRNELPAGIAGRVSYAVVHERRPDSPPAEAQGVGAQERARTSSGVTQVGPQACLPPLIASCGWQ